MIQILKKKILLFCIGIAALIILLSISTVALLRRNPNAPVPSPQLYTATPSPVPVQKITPLTVVNTDPADKQNNVPVNQIFSITGSRDLVQDDISFAIEPIVPYQTTILHNKLIITFQSNLSPHTTYTYSLRFRNQNSVSYTFTTAGAESAANNDTFSQNLMLWSLRYKPDLFVHNKSPYTTADFSVTSDMTATQPYHFFFTVSLPVGNKEQEKQAFINWLVSLGLTQAQIQNLDIHYQ